MANIDILSVFNTSLFSNNTPNWSKPDGYNNFKYSSSNYVRMLSFSNQVTANNGEWNLEINVKKGDVIRWIDTTNDQGADCQDMIVYNLRISDPDNWNKYLSSLVADEFHSNRCYLQTEFGVIPPKFQYTAGPNNYLTTSVTKAPSSAIKLNYYLYVVKLKIDNGLPTPVGTYGIDPAITIKPS